MSARTTGAAAVVVAALALAPAAEAAQTKTLGKAGGYTYVRDTETIQGTSGASGEANARCPEETVSISGGASIAGPSADSFLSLSSKASLRQWFVEGWHLAFDDSKLESYAICSKKLSQYYDAGFAVSAAPGPASVSGTTSCPSGAAVGNGVRPVGVPTDWVINSSFAIDEADADLFPDDASRAFALHTAGTGSSSMLVDVFCLTGPEPEYAVKDKSSAIPTQSVKAKCPAGTVAIGGGAFVSGSVGDAHLVKSIPYDSKDKGKVPEDGWTVTFANDDVPTTLTFQAIATCR